jgi:hypothetical protein
MRILIANTPLMYRESLALAVHRHNPDFEVMIADPASLDGEAERFGPHTLIRDDHLKVRISLDGKVSEIHEVSLYELLAALDEAARFVSENGIANGSG